MKMKEADGTYHPLLDLVKSFNILSNAISSNPALRHKFRL